ncbi:hypothetical protein P692DRAFT_20652215, partial [Suillus brevipes Sb2]
SPPPPVTSKRSGRTVRMPRRFVDYLPGTATHLAHMPPTNRQQRGRALHETDQLDHDRILSPLPVPSSDPDDPRPVLIPFQTEPDTMGLYRVYPTRPTLAPEGNLTLERVTDAPTLDS